MIYPKLVKWTCHKVREVDSVKTSMDAELKRSSNVVRESGMCKIVQPM